MIEKLGKYQIAEQIGRGGMGAVYKASDPLLKRVVALKVISENVDESDELRARFARHAAAALASDLDWQTADQAATLAMRLAGPSPAPSRQIFKMLCRISPSLALRIRESLIRALKPQYRAGHPGWRSPIRVIP
jgi:serine/threonine protein kinase